VEPRIRRVLRNVGIEKEMKYVGKRAISSTAVGISELHKRECEELMKWVQ
jgi:2-oxoglutarate dehydrogenase complex dehydrogenase (E1) component-like enzyme